MLDPQSPEPTLDPRLGTLAPGAHAMPVPLTRPYRPHPEAMSTPSDPEAERLLRLFYDHLVGLGHEVGRWEVVTPHTRRPLAVDLLDLTARRLIVGRGNAHRPAVQEAIGELLDISDLFNDTFDRFLLLPCAPDSDLSPLLQRLRITTIWPELAGFRDGTGALG
ncbi:hypothetical protein ACIREO_23420 [Streptomyces sp. NPDC102441]|uniref:hypothetical protein n=1 Tax=Streptomyces sp. NPDC102441 TaxID=3366176 RepID=UPI00382E0882